jgi:Glycosyl transferase family 2
MNIHLYALCWNDAKMLGFFFRHYDRFVTKYVIFDDGSTDESIDILSRHPRVSIRRMPEGMDSFSTDNAVAVWDHCWKESRGRADWVIVGEIDEHLDHHDLPSYLHNCAVDGITIVPALGYQMISREFPSPKALLRNDHTVGAPWPGMSKLSIFNPDAIRETNFGAGRHSATPTGRVYAPERDEVLNLHYKYLSIEHVFERNQQLAARLGSEDIRRGRAHKWRWDMDALAEDWAAFETASVDLAAPDFDPSRAHSSPPWWEPFRKSHQISRGSALRV